MRWLVGGSILLLLLVAAASAQDHTGLFTERLEVDGPLTLGVSTPAGAVRIVQGDPGVVEISGRIRVSERGRSAARAQEIVDAFEASPPVDFSAGRLQVGNDSALDREQNVSISYDLRVPPDTSVASTTGSGEQDISGVSGSVDAQTGSGSLRLTGIQGDVSARTGSGSIEADSIAGAFRGSTGSGSIVLTQTAPGDVDVTTGSGSIELRGLNGALRAQTGSGRIRVEGAPAGRWDLDTGSGAIELRLPTGIGFELDAESSSGQVSTDHPITVVGEVERGRLQGSAGGGGPLLRLRTGSGRIQIR